MPLFKFMSDIISNNVRPDICPNGHLSKGVKKRHIYEVTTGRIYSSSKFTYSSSPGTMPPIYFQKLPPRSNRDLGLLA